MRSREEIIKDKKTGLSLVEQMGNPQTAVQSAIALITGLSLEVLLDIRDLLTNTK
jgi:hypothetical protein